MTIDRSPRSSTYRWRYGSMETSDLGVVVHIVTYSLLLSRAPPFQRYSGNRGICIPLLYFMSRVRRNPPPPSKFRNNNAEINKNERILDDRPASSCFDTIPECHGWTDGRNCYRAAWTRVTLPGEWIRGLSYSALHQRKCLVFVIVCNP